MWGAGRCVNCGHFEVQVTITLESHWEWRVHPMEAGTHWVRKYNVMYSASLDVPTVFTVATTARDDCGDLGGDRSTWIDYRGFAG